MVGVAGKIGVAALGSTAGAAAAADTAAVMLLAGAIAGTSATYKSINTQHLKLASVQHLCITDIVKAGLAAY